MHISLNWNTCVYSSTNWNIYLERTMNVGVLILNRWQNCNWFYGVKKTAINFNLNWTNTLGQNIDKADDSAPLWRMPTGTRFKTNQTENKEINHLKDYIVHNWITGKLLSSARIPKEKTLPQWGEATTSCFRTQVQACFPLHRYWIPLYATEPCHLTECIQEWDLDSSLTLCPTDTREQGLRHKQCKFHAEASGKKQVGSRSTRWFLSQQPATHLQQWWLRTCWPAAQFWRLH